MSKVEIPADFLEKIIAKLPPALREELKFLMQKSRDSHMSDANTVTRILINLNRSPAKKTGGANESRKPCL